jgi:predicted PurR-regulated permease PerM
LLVVVAGLFAIGYVLNILFAVAFALFFALLVTAWTGPVMRLFEKKLPKVISMILALLLISAAIVAILSVVVASVVGEGPKLVASIKSGLSDITEWVRKPPLSLSDDQFSSLVSDAQNAGTSVAKGVAGEALAAFGSHDKSAHRIDRAHFAFHGPVGRGEECTMPTQRVARQEGLDQRLIRRRERTTEGLNERREQIQREA